MHEEHATNGQQQEQPGERDPRHLPPQKSWAEVIAKQNRVTAALKCRNEALRTEIAELTRENKRLEKVIRERDAEIILWEQAADWDDGIENGTIKVQEKSQADSCEEPPF